MGQHLRRSNWSRRLRFVSVVVAFVIAGALAADAPGAIASSNAPPGVDPPWPMHPIDSRFRGANALSPGDVDGDGEVDYVTNYEFDQRYVVTFTPSRRADRRRAWPSGARSDSVYVSIDGQNRTVVGDVGIEPSRWTWVQVGEPITLRPGPHTLTLQVRERGTAVDRIVLAPPGTPAPTN